MTIPTHEAVMYPLLDEIRDGGIHALAEVRRRLAARLQLSPEELSQMLPSGRTSTFASRVYWAKTHLYKAQALDSPARGQVQINSRGRELLDRSSKEINRAVLLRFPEFAEWIEKSTRGRGQGLDSQDPAGALAPQAGELDPEEAIELSIGELQSSVEDDVLTEVRRVDPKRFEKLVVDLLMRLGYGGTGGAGHHLGQGGDGGVDGVIYEDKLGLERIYVQAKRWENSVGRPQVQAFAGSLEGQRARKGVLITTSTFTRDAVDFVDRIEKRIVLIDGRELARLMYEVGLGVTTQHTYEIKRLDSDYFVVE
jgi:restriction system protein